MSNYSKVYKYDKNHYFVYDYENGLVHYITKITDSMKEDNEEWQSKYGEDLWKPMEGVEGFTEIDAAGLSKENWDDVSQRRYYLSVYIEDLNGELQYMIQLGDTHGGEYQY